MMSENNKKRRFTNFSAGDWWKTTGDPSSSKSSFPPPKTGGRDPSSPPAAEEEKYHTAAHYFRGVGKSAPSTGAGVPPFRRPYIPHISKEKRPAPPSTSLRRETKIMGGPNRSLDGSNRNLDRSNRNVDRSNRNVDRSNNQNGSVDLESGQEVKVDCNACTFGRSLLDLLRGKKFNPETNVAYRFGTDYDLHPRPFQKIPNTFLIFFTILFGLVAMHAYVRDDGYPMKTHARMFGAVEYIFFSSQGLTLLLFAFPHNHWISTSSCIYCTYGSWMFATTHLMEETLNLVHIQVIFLLECIYR